MKGKNKQQEGAHAKPQRRKGGGGEFRKRVIAWFAKNGRDLPWRRTADPYAILVSEIMCQQTQVGTVVPYFERWMGRFPDCKKLAAATEHEVMSLWQGLGYYSRARNLHAAAKAVAAAGEFPGEIEAIRGLPGVGRYTAGAIAAFAYDKPAALVDANIARVLARVFAVREAINGPGLARVWEEAEGLQADQGGRAFNAGLMEIGALICTPRAPRCGECPIAEFCEAKAQGLQEALPAKKPKPRTVRVTERCALITRDGAVLLEHQNGSRWRGLWKLPGLKQIPEKPPELMLEYPFTHHKVTLAVYRQPCRRSKGPGCEWWQIANLKDVPIAAGHRRAVERLVRIANC